MQVDGTIAGVLLYTVLLAVEEPRGPEESACVEYVTSILRCLNLVLKLP